MSSNHVTRFLFPFGEDRKHGFHSKGKSGSKYSKVLFPEFPCVGLSQHTNYALSMSQTWEDPLGSPCGPAPSASILVTWVHPSAVTPHSTVHPTTIQDAALPCTKHLPRAPGSFSSYHLFPLSLWKKWLERAIHTSPDLRANRENKHASPQGTGLWQNMPILEDSIQDKDSRLKVSEIGIIAGFLRPSAF